MSVVATNAAVWQSYADASLEHRDVRDLDVRLAVHAAQGEAEILILANQGRLY